MCALTERDRDGSRLRVSVSLHVKTNVCTRATVIKDEETDGKASCGYVQVT